jgi:outer membrane protein OmpA-like peptidoglycan-associated protein
MKKRSLDYDGLDGILQQPDASIQRKAAWYKSGWFYGLVGIVLAGVFFLQKTPTQPVTTSNNSTEQTKPATPAAANSQKSTEPAHSALAEPTQIQAAATPVTPDQSVAPNASESDINAPVAQPAEIAAVSTAKPVEASTADTTVAQTESQAPQPSEAIPPVNDTPVVNSSSEALFTVHFKLDSSKLNALSSSESAELINAAKRCTKLIKLTGHTCNLGTDASNKTLGLTRAKAVRKLLLNNGFDANRIITTSEGMNNPVASNDTPAGQALNRRTELSCQDE